MENFELLIFAIEVNYFFYSHAPPPLLAWPTKKTLLSGLLVFLFGWRYLLRKIGNPPPSPDQKKRRRAILFSSHRLSASENVFFSVHAASKIPRRRRRGGTPLRYCGARRSSPLSSFLDMFLVLQVSIMTTRLICSFHRLSAPENAPFSVLAALTSPPRLGHKNLFTHGGARRASPC